MSVNKERSSPLIVGAALRRQGQQRGGAEGLHSVQPQVEPVERPQRHELGARGGQFLSLLDFELDPKG